LDTSVNTVARTRQQLVEEGFESVLTRKHSPASATHMGAHTSARTQRIEVITRGERRRRWSAEEKQAIVAESTQPHASIAGIARKHGIGTGQLYSWRHQFLVSHPGKAASFARVQLLSEPHRLGGPAGPRGRA
jgi:hypothetical protein